MEVDRNLASHMIFNLGWPTALTKWTAARLALKLNSLRDSVKGTEVLPYPEQHQLLHRILEANNAGEQITVDDGEIQPEYKPEGAIAPTESPTLAETMNAQANGCAGCGRELGQAGFCPVCTETAKPGCVDSADMEESTWEPESAVTKPKRVGGRKRLSDAERAAKKEECRLKRKANGKRLQIPNTSRLVGEALAAHKLDVTKETAETYLKKVHPANYEITEKDRKLARLYLLRCRHMVLGFFQTAGIQYPS